MPNTQFPKMSYTLKILLVNAWTNSINYANIYPQIKQRPTELKKKKVKFIQLPSKETPVEKFRVTHALERQNKEVRACYVNQ